MFGKFFLGAIAAVSLVAGGAIAPAEAQLIGATNDQMDPIYALNLDVMAAQISRNAITQLAQDQAMIVDNFGYDVALEAIKVVRDHDIYRSMTYLTEYDSCAGLQSLESQHPHAAFRGYTEAFHDGIGGDIRVSAVLAVSYVQSLGAVCDNGGFL